MDKYGRKRPNIFIGRKIHNLIWRLNTIKSILLLTILLFVLLYLIPEACCQQGSSNFFESVQVLTLPTGNKKQPELISEAVKRATINAFLQYFGSKYEREIGGKFDQLLALISKDTEKFIRGYKIVTEKRTEPNYTVLLKISISNSVIEQIERELNFTQAQAQPTKEAKTHRILVLVLHIKKNSFDYWWKEEGYEVPLSMQEKVIDHSLRSLNYDPIMRVNLQNLGDELKSPFLDELALRSLLKEAGTQNGLFITWNEIEEEHIKLEIVPFNISETLVPHSFIFDKKDYEANNLGDQLSLKLKHSLESAKKSSEKEMREMGLKISNYKNVKTLQEILSFLQAQRVILGEVVPKEMTAAYATYVIKTYYTKEEFTGILKGIEDWSTKAEILLGQDGIVEIHCLQGE